MTTMAKAKFSGPMAWNRATALPNDGLTLLDGACREEIAAAAQLLRDNPLPIEALRPEDFEMPACHALMAAVRETLDHGTGLTVIDRLDVDGLGREAATGIYWLLMSMVARPVAQKWRGTLVYDVRDTGAKMRPGSGVHASATSSATGFHNDNSCNLPPDFVSLFCLQTAKQGGLSGIVSFESVCNRLLEAHRDILPRLCQPFDFDRVGEHAPGDDSVSRKPIFEFDGDELHVNFSPGLVRLACLMRGEAMDEAARAALDALCAATEAEDLCKWFEFQRGQIQVVNNRRLAHCRTAFRDGDEPEYRRHLVRLWLRKSGRPFYQG